MTLIHPQKSNLSIINGQGGGCDGNSPNCPENPIPPKTGDCLRPSAAKFLVLCCKKILPGGQLNSILHFFPPNKAQEYSPPGPTNPPPNIFRPPPPLRITGTNAFYGLFLLIIALCTFKKRLERCAKTDFPLPIVCQHCFQEPFIDRIFVIIGGN